MQQYSDKILGKRYLNDGKMSVKLNARRRKALENFKEELGKGEIYRTEEYKCECGASEQDFEVLAEKDRYGIPMRTVICKQCGLVMTNPRMTQDGYDAFYCRYFGKIYRNDFGGDESLESIAKKFNDRKKKGESIHAYITGIVGNSFRTVLDIGCAAGGVLKAFDEKGLVTEGIDLDDTYLDFGRSHGLNLVTGHSSTLVGKGRHDIILLCHVFEHFLDIQGELEVIRDLLNEGGYLYIEVPGIKMLEMGSYDYSFLEFLQNAHVRSFSLTTLTDVLEKYGFELVSGTEEVRAIFRYTGKSGKNIRNDYTPIIRSLKSAETIYRRKIPKRLAQEMVWLLARICPDGVKKALKIILQWDRQEVV